MVPTWNVPPDARPDGAADHAGPARRVQSTRRICRGNGCTITTRSAGGTALPATMPRRQEREVCFRYGRSGWCGVPGRSIKLLQGEDARECRLSRSPSCRVPRVLSRACRSAYVRRLRGSGARARVRTRPRREQHRSRQPPPLGTAILPAPSARTVDRNLEVNLDGRTAKPNSRNRSGYLAKRHRLRRVSCGGRPGLVVAPAPLCPMRPCRLLRRLAQPARACPRRKRGPPLCQKLRTGRRLVLLLPGRGVHRGRRARAAELTSTPPTSARPRREGPIQLASAAPLAA
jgi:hypothetical protein